MNQRLFLRSAAFLITLLAVASTATPPSFAADSLVVLSTTDVKGKTMPCGCHIPKGGLSRWASFVDSTRARDAKVLAVVNGGFFPEPSNYQPVASFYMEALHSLGADAVGLGENELRYGRGFLMANLKRTRLNMTCANLLARESREPLVTPHLIKNVGGTRVGVFALISDKVDLGPSRDSLVVEDPQEAAKKAVERLRRGGATVVVLLSELGKVQSEDLVAAVPGIDVLIAGRNVPMYPKGRMIKNTVVCYGGEQGQYMGRTMVALNGKQAMADGSSETVMLGPEISEKPAVQAMVKAFEDGFAEKLRRASSGATEAAPAATKE
jgi:2',3'-cyclic-nucleotide 2'-phosphodiesterase (5'-nucleotidase family)